MRAAPRSRKPAIAARRSAKRKPKAKAPEHQLNEQYAEPQIDVITAIGAIVEINRRLEDVCGVLELVAASSVAASARARKTLCETAARAARDLDADRGTIGDLIVGMLTAKPGEAQ